MSFDLKPISTDKKLNDNFIILLWNRSNKIKNYSQNLKTQYTQMDLLRLKKMLDINSGRIHLQILSTLKICNILTLKNEALFICISWLWPPTIAIQNPLRQAAILLSKSWQKEHKLLSRGDSHSHCTY